MRERRWQGKDCSAVGMIAEIVIMSLSICRTCTRENQMNVYDFALSTEEHSAGSNVTNWNHQLTKTADNKKVGISSRGFFL